jgi:hypothetical protein
MKPILFAAASAVLFLTAGCSGEKQPPYRTDKMEVAEVMGDVVDFGAQTFWHSAGYIDTAEGTTSLTPTTDEGWLAAGAGAAIVAEAGNVLMLPGRARDNGDWLKLAGQLYDRSHEGMVAAEDGHKAWMAIQEAKEKNTRDPAAEAALAAAEIRMFDTGGRMYEVCVACHEKYLLPFLDEEGEKKTKAPLKGN